MAGLLSSSEQNTQDGETPINKYCMCCLRQYGKGRVFPVLISKEMDSYQRSDLLVYGDRMMVGPLTDELPCSYRPNWRMS